MMRLKEIFEELQSKISDLFKDFPKEDIKHNAEAMLKQVFSKFELVTLEEFEVQKQVLARTRMRLEALEHRVDQLEQQRQLAHNPPKTDL